MAILMTGGGTGGHLVIIKAVKEYLHEETLCYIGSTKGQDQQWFAQDDDFAHKYFFETRGVVNQGLLGKIKSLLMIVKATFKSITLIRKHKARVVFSVGGFSSAPMAFAAKLTRTPLVIHEQNAALGTVNKLLKPYTTHFISSYLEESVIKAYPIKKTFFEFAHVRTKVDTLIFLGGSQGAKAINALALAIAPALKEKNINIIHQAGVNNVDEIQKAYADMGIDAEVFGFTTKLSTYMNDADFAIARAGASTLWELSASAIPTLYIPYPYAASDHQYHNAKFLKEKNLAWIMREKEIDTEGVLSLLEGDLSTMSSELMAFVEKEGSPKIAQLLKSFS